MADEKQILLDGADIAKAVTRMAHEIVEKSGAPGELVLIGIRSRGVHLARRLARRIQELLKISLPLGVLDVTAYRDDRGQERDVPAMNVFETVVKVDDKIVVLVDDVIFRGRTIRAAMEAVERMGQPKRMLVATLIDRGARELPIRADVVGKNIEAGDDKRVNVLLEEADGVDQVVIAEWQNRSAVK